MAVSTLTPVSFDLTSPPNMQLSAAPRVDMDIDMDLELGSVEDLTAMEAEAMKIEVPAQEADEERAQLGSPSSPSSSDPNHLTPHKVHLRGLDNLRTNDIRAFAIEHFSESQPLRVEWIDDTSANLVYTTAAMATKALTSFSVLASEESLLSISMLQLRAAKPVPGFPDARLEVRLAVITDRKQPGARDRSRFYLFNPQEDPGERRSRDGRDRRKRGRGHANSGEYGDYRRRRYDDDEQRRRRNTDDGGGFDVNLYDDDAGGVVARDDTRHDSLDGDFGRRNSRRYVRFDESNARELFPEREGRKRNPLRDRSASPYRNSDVDQEMEIDDLSSKRRRFRERSRSPERSPRDRNTSNHRPNTGKELFPGKSVVTTSSDSGVALDFGGGIKDISAELRGVTETKELFPQKAQQISHHRRSGAFDAADETADLFAGRMSVPFTDGATDTRGRNPRGVVGEEQRLGEFSIRGAARQKQSDRGLSIRGAAAAAAAATATAAQAMIDVDDDTGLLFPQKAQLASSNAGKELFAEKLLGRGGRRRKAEDMFY